MRQYNKQATDSRGNRADLDDGVFVAVPDGGPCSGYTYYALGFHRSGAVDGGPAFLPQNPAQFKQTHHGHSYHKSNQWSFRSGYLRTWGITHPRSEQDIVITPLRDGAILPKGTLFFWWISGGGSFSIPFTMLAPLESDTLTIHAKTTPKNEFEAIWFEESETVSVSFKVYEMSPETYENQWRNTY